MRTFEQFINEMEIGNQLFADPTDMKSANFSRNDFMVLLNKAGMSVEANTKDEKKFLDKLINWTGSTSVKMNINDMKFLLTQKKKFPAILDPTYNGSTIAYRGTKVSFSRLAKMNFSQMGQSFVTNSVSFKEKTGTRGFSSFSTEKDVARQFIEEQFYETGEIVEKAMFPVMLTLNANHTDLLFNPEFTNMFTEQSGEENEIFIVTPTYTPTSVIIYNPHEFMEIAKDDDIWEELMDNPSAALFFKKLK